MVYVSCSVQGFDMMGAERAVAARPSEHGSALCGVSARASQRKHQATRCGEGGLGMRATSLSRRLRARHMRSEHISFSPDSNGNGHG
eukprot:scaffold8160_cov126-Isochrysis_galbana.AAC.1